MPKCGMFRVPKQMPRASPSYKVPELHGTPSPESVPSLKASSKPSPHPAWNYAPLPILSPKPATCCSSDRVCHHAHIAFQARLVPAAPSLCRVAFAGGAARSSGFRCVGASALDAPNRI
jgi:hypothetical protein